MTTKRYEVWVSDTGEASHWKLLSVWESYHGAVSHFDNVSGGYVAAVIEEWDVGRNVFLRVVYDKRGVTES